MVGLFQDKTSFAHRSVSPQGGSRYLSDRRSVSWPVPEVGSLRRIRCRPKCVNVAGLLNHQSLKVAKSNLDRQFTCVQPASRICSILLRIHYFAQKNTLGSKMADYTGLAGSIFGEPEHRDKTDIVVAFYLILNSDMIGVCPIRPSTVAPLCMTSPPKLLEVLRYFESLDKLTLSVTLHGGRGGVYPTHAWWRSKLYHTLYKGKGSPKQTLGATSLIRKWGVSGVFGGGWASAFSQLYDTKYNIKIPIPNQSETHTDKSESEEETETETEKEEDSKKKNGLSKNVDNSKEKKESGNPKLDDYRKWKKDHQSELVAISKTYPGGVEWVKSHTLDIETDIIEKPDKYHQIGGQKWLNWVKGWLKRAAEQNQAGNSGLKEPMSADEEEQHYERHRDNNRSRGGSEPTTMGDVIKKETGE